MNRRGPNHCTFGYMGSIDGRSTWIECGRPLPCTLHAGFEPEYSEIVLGPRPAVFGEILARRICLECVRGVERHDNGGPTIDVLCSLHDEYLGPHHTCGDFVAAFPLWLAEANR